MIVSKLKIDFSDAPWSMVNGARARAQNLFEAAAMRDVLSSPGQNGQRPSLGELLYRALVEPMEMAR